MPNEMIAKAKIEERTFDPGERLKEEWPKVLLSALFPPPLTAATPCGEAFVGRSTRLLGEHGATTLGDVARHTADEILGWHGFGPSRLNDVKAVLRRAGLRLKMPAENNTTPVYEVLVDLSVRSRRCLWKLDIRTIGQLLSTPKTELLAVRKFGKVSLAEIDAKLRLDGFVWR